jgi:hypothetical protein
MNLKEIQKELKGRIAKGLNFGIEAVEEVISESTDLYNDYILLKSKYNDLMYLSSLNTLPYEQIALGLDRLRSSLIGIIDRMEAGDLKKKDVASELKVQALPTRRTNFFKLLDIHFKNLEAVSFVEIMGEQETRIEGREAIFELYQMQRRKFRNREDILGEAGKSVLQPYFYDYFSHEKGILEVYFKNIKHLLTYTWESEIERQFFLNTIRSLFSKYELALIFYYAVSEVDASFRDLVVKSNLIDESVKGVLIESDHYDWLS